MQNIILFVKALVLTGILTGVGVVFALVLVWELVRCVVNGSYELFTNSRYR